jgi:hypothetical protein
MLFDNPEPSPSLRAPGFLDRFVFWGRVKCRYDVRMRRRRRFQTGNGERGVRNRTELRTPDGSAVPRSAFRIPHFL